MGVGMPTDEHCISARLPTCLLDSGPAAQSILRTKNFHGKFYDSFVASCNSSAPSCRPYTPDLYSIRQQL
jgi:hypothetical protein